MKFHLDENVSEAVGRGLQRRGIDVTTSPQCELLGASDEQQIAYCLREERVMLTHDADMLRLAAAGTAPAGIAYCHVRQQSILLHPIAAFKQPFSSCCIDGDRAPRT